MSGSGWTLRVVVAAMFGVIHPAAADQVSLDRRIILTDQSVEVLGEVAGLWNYQVARLTPWGLEPAVEGHGEGAGFRIPPRGEGLHIVTIDRPIRAELRFLALAVPEEMIDPEALRDRLPRFAEKLLSGQPVTILAAGDSVTATGDYPIMLKLLLERLTGNPDIRIAVAAYPGKSADAAVRHWERDIDPAAPDLLLVMFGLNDQSGGVPRQAYLAHHRWMAERMRELGGEVVFLEPTPVARETTDAAGVPRATRTAVFAHALNGLGRELGIPVAHTFAAIWGAGDPDPRRAGRLMRPLFPPHYSKSFESAAEPGRSLDPVHPNALGHAALARAVLDAMHGPSPQKFLDAAGRSEWTEGGVVSRLTFRNLRDAAWTGRIDLVPPGGAEIQAQVWAGTLAPGAAVTLPMSWKQAVEPSDLLGYPMDRYLAEADPAVVALLSSDGRTRIEVVDAPFAVTAEVLADRQITHEPAATVRIHTDAGPVVRRVTWPTDRAVGRISIVEAFEHEGHTGWAVGEVVYLRVPAARVGETEIDGELIEWANADWTPLDDPVQARWTQGSHGLSAPQIPIKLEMAVRAGARGVALAFRYGSDVEGNRFFVWFDPRPPEKLGTVGPYYWIIGEFVGPDRVRLRRGETSPADARLDAAVGRGGLELFVPYPTMRQTGWPESGDLGLSVDWQSVDANGQTVHQLWADNGHPWNPRWFGLVQRVTTAPALERYRVRIK